MSAQAQATGWRRGVRSFLQTLAGGGFAGAIGLIIEGFPPELAVPMTIVIGSIIAYLQNYLETAGKIPVLFPVPGLISPVTINSSPLIAPAAEATVEATVSKTGQVKGAVTDTEGETIGKVSGNVSEEPG